MKRQVPQVTSRGSGAHPCSRVSLMSISGRRMPGLVTALCGIALASCSGRASIYMVPLGPKPIRTAGPLVIHVSPDECYYWVNDEQDVCVAMRAGNASPLGKRFQREFLASLVLDGQPAGPARYYRAGRRTLRARETAGYTHTRAASLGGIIVIWDYGTGKLAGRFRLTAKQQAYSVLTGWRGDRRVLFIGEFTAIMGRRAGRKILARTEEDGMARAPAPPKPIPVQGPPRNPPLGETVPSSDRG